MYEGCIGVDVDVDMDVNVNANVDVDGGERGYMGVQNACVYVR